MALPVKREIKMPPPSGIRIARAIRQALPHGVRVDLVFRELDFLDLVVGLVFWVFSVVF